MICLSVVSHGQREVSLALLRDLERLKPPSIRRIVYTANIDEAALPDLALGDIELEVIRNDAPKGFGANHNAAFRRCRERFFCVLNPDIRFTQDPFPALLSPFDTAPELGLVAPRMTDPDGRLQNTARTLYSPAEMIRQKLRPADAGARADWLAGMFLLVRSEAYSAIDGFDERYFLYIEDVDFCSRLALAGWSLRQVPEVVVIHDARKQSHRSLRYTRWHLAGMLRYWTGSSYWRYLRANRPSRTGRPPGLLASAQHRMRDSIRANGGLRNWLQLRSDRARRIGLGNEVRLLLGKLSRSADAAESSRRYDRWIEQEAGRDAEALRQAPPPPLVRGKTPRFSVLMPTWEASAEHFRIAVESVLKQTEPDWELIIVDDGSPSLAARQQLQQAATLDTRIRVQQRETNGHICAASNSALALASGDFLVLLDHDDTLHPMALYWLAASLAARPELDLIYSDEDKLDDALRSSPYFKSDLNPGLLMSQNMISHLGAYRRSVVEQLGGFREGYEGSQDYDLALRVIAASGPQAVAHIPRVLYHWRRHLQSTASHGGVKPYAFKAGLRALDDFLAATARPGRAAGAPEVPGMYRIHYPALPPGTRVDAIIVDDGSETVGRCLDAVRAQQGQLDLRIVVLAGGSATAGSSTVVPTPADPTPASALPFGPRLDAVLRNSDAPFVVLLGSGVEPFGDGSLMELLSPCAVEEIGLVAGRIWTHQGKLARGGLGLRPGGWVEMLHQGLARGDPGPFGLAALQQDHSAVACDYLAFRRAVFLEAGGLDYPGDHLAAEVALGLNIRQAGRRVYWTPYAEARYSRPSGPAAVCLQDVAPALVSQWQASFDWDPCSRADPTRPEPPHPASVGRAGAAG